MGASSIDSSINIPSKCNLERIEYDESGRMRYNPQFHIKQGKPWSKEDLQYLIDWYEIIGGQEMSFALERTVGSIYSKYLQIKKRDGKSHQIK